MRILVISNSPWDDSNSFGSTFSNFFQGVDKDTIASVYCSGGTPNTNSCSRFFQIAEKDLARSAFKRKKAAGKEVLPLCNEEKTPVKKSKMMSFVKTHRWVLFFWAREILWKIGKWKSEGLDNFINSFKPDIIVLPTYSFSYINKLALYIHKKWNLPMVSYVSDDEYTLRQFSISPLYWMNRFYQRIWVKRGIVNSRILYTISNVQKSDYEKCFSVPCKVLTKFLDFDASPACKQEYGKKLRLVYTGNIGGNRWKSLALIAKAIQEINAIESRLQLEIYTATPITKRMEKALNIVDCSEIKGRVSAKEVRLLQEEADVLVHVEAMDLKNRLSVRQSFSTKIVDYFKAARPILAVGPTSVASLQHLIENDCAMIGNSKDTIIAELKKAIEDPSYLALLSERAYECGRKHHNRKEMQEMFLTDMQEICGEPKNENS